MRKTGPALKEINNQNITNRSAGDGEMGRGDGMGTEMEVGEVGMIEMGGEVGWDGGEGGPLELSFVAVRRKVRGGRQGI